MAPSKEGLEYALREIVEGTAGETGDGFFDALVRHLARAAGTGIAWVTEWVPEGRRLRALSFWVEDRFVKDYEYPIAGTPCEGVVCERKEVLVKDRLIELYPGDPDLKPMGAVSYLGVPLLDTDGSLLGHLAVMHQAPLQGDERLLAIFRIFAARASAELRRLRRDRDLAERERKLALLIDSAMDGIIEFDASGRITRVNAAAKTTLGFQGEAGPGVALEGLLTSVSRGKLAYLIGRLEAEKKSSLFIPDGLEGVRATGEPFMAEATLSRFESEGRPFHVIILRDIESRLAAEAQVRALMQEALQLRAEIDDLFGVEGIIGQSAALRRALDDLEMVARTDTAVLITGETGTGKELFARALHRRSDRAQKPLVMVNCAAIAASLQESEFFGHEKGAFTGATQKREGRFKLADGGSIFLDEVGEMSPDLQAKLLRVLQEGEFQPVGSSRSERVNVRLLAATNRDLEKMVRAGDFREDLFYRLNVFPLHLPALRERGEDVLLLAEHFARRLGERRGRVMAPLTPVCRARLLRYDWPGNVRELHNVIERAVITSTDGRRLNLDRALPETPSTPAAPAAPDSGRVLSDAELRDLERRNLENALALANGRLSGTGGAAALLGINPNTLSSRMRSLGVSRPSRRS